MRALWQTRPAAVSTLQQRKRALTAAERAALRAARATLRGARSFSQVLVAVASLRADLRGELARGFLRSGDDEARLWLEARTVWDLVDRTEPEWLPLLRWLDLWRCHELDPALLRWLTSLEALRHLRGLRLDECSLGSESLRVLGESRAFPRLRCFSASNNFALGRRCDASALARVFSPGWRGLRELDLSHNVLDADSFEVLGRATSLWRVESLRLRVEELGAAGARGLLRRGAWPSLTSLELTDTVRLGESLPVLLASRVAKQLTHLSLSQTGLTPELLGALLEVLPDLESLQLLDLSENPLGERGAELLARSRLPARLRRLSLDSCGITREGAAALAASRPDRQDLWGGVEGAPPTHSPEGLPSSSARSPKQ